MKSKKSLQATRLKKIERNKLARKEKTRLLATQTLLKKSSEKQAKLNKLKPTTPKTIIQPNESQT